MTTPAIWLVATLFAAAAVFTVLLLFPTKEGSSRTSAEEDGISVSTGGGVVTVRKVGRVTSVIIRQEIHDHMEGGDSIDIPQLPIEVTRREEPELYAEYVSPETTAVRKYEIADDLYSRGYTLPWIRGLHEQYKKETDRGPETVHGRAPVDLTPRKAEAPPRELAPDRSLQDVDQPDMGDGVPEEGTQENE